MTATPPRADLRTLIRRAIVMPSEFVARLGDESFSAWAARAVEAAVLPEHRRLVLGEAAEALGRSIEWQREHYGTPSATADRIEVIAYGRLFGLEDALGLVRHLAAAAPETTLSARVPAETAPAVPEEVDGQRTGEGDALAAAALKANSDKTTVRAVQRWMALDPWVALGDDSAAFDAAIDAAGWAVTWADLLGRVDALADNADQTEDGHGH